MLRDARKSGLMGRTAAKIIMDGWPVWAVSVHGVELFMSLLSPGHLKLGNLSLNDWRMTRLVSAQKSLVKERSGCLGCFGHVRSRKALWGRRIAVRRSCVRSASQYLFLWLVALGNLPTTTFTILTVNA